MNVNEPVEVKTSDLPLTAYAITKYSASVLDHDLAPEGKVYFRLLLPKGVTFSKIESDFLSNGATGAISFAEAIRALKRIVISARKGVRS